MSLTIVLSNQKGGVGKTTSAYVLSTALKEKGYKVLAVDMDPQGNLSFAMGADTESATIYDVLKGELKPRYAVQKSALVDIIPSNILLSGIELEFTGARREFLLKEALESLKSSYDYILIDSPPALGVLTVNAFTASDYVLVPMLSDIFSLQGITQLDETICRVRNYCNPRIQILGVFLTKHNPRTNSAKKWKAPCAWWQRIWMFRFWTHLSGTALRFGKPSPFSAPCWSMRLSAMRCRIIRS